jgi:predicted small integral membrane protein
MYTELDASLIPFGGAINAILAAGNVPQALWWMPFIYIFICIIGMLVYEATGPKGAPQVGSLLAMCVAIEILLVLFAVLGTVGVSGMIPLWSAILFIFPAAALIFSRRHVGWG